MQENNFEKQVAQKMEELNLQPSAPVWQNIEAQIQKDRRRRRVLFWLLPVLIAGGVGFWLIAPLDKEGQARMAKDTSSTVKHRIPKIDSTSVTKKIKPHLNNSKAIDTETSGTIPKPANSGTNPVNARIVHSEKSMANTASARTANKLFNTNVVEKKVDRSLIEPTAQLSTSTGIRSSDVETGINAHPVNKESIADTIAIQLTELTTETSLFDSGKIPVNQPIDTVVATPKAPAVAKAKQNWQWTVSAKAGTSAATSGFLGNLNKSMDQAPGYNNSTGNFVLRPAVPARGTAYSVGVGVKKPIHRKSLLKVGLQYSYYSTVTRVGSRVADSTVFVVGNSATNNAYRNNNYNTLYTNRYHYLELPIAFEYRVFKKLPLQVHHGVSYGRLLRTNALYYSSAANVYYTDKDRLAKTQLHLFTGVTYTLWQRKKFSLQAGPNLQYGITQLKRKTSSNNRHIIMAGLQTTISF